MNSSEDLTAAGAGPEEGEWCHFIALPDNTAYAGWEYIGKILNIRPDMRARRIHYTVFFTKGKAPDTGVWETTRGKGGIYADGWISEPL